MFKTFFWAIKITACKTRLAEVNTNMVHYLRLNLLFTTNMHRDLRWLEHENTHMHTFAKYKEEIQTLWGMEGVYLKEK